MATHSWRAFFRGEEWGADGQTVFPSELATFVTENVGPRTTYWGKPYVLDPKDPGSVRDAFLSDIDPRGEAQLLALDMDPALPDGKEY